MTKVTEDGLAFQSRVFLGSPGVQCAAPATPLAHVLRVGHPTAVHFGMHVQ